MSRCLLFTSEHSLLVSSSESQCVSTCLLLFQPSYGHIAEEEGLEVKDFCGWGWGVVLAYARLSMSMSVYIKRTSGCGWGCICVGRLSRKARVYETCDQLFFSHCDSVRLSVPSKTAASWFFDTYLCLHISAIELFWNHVMLSNKSSCFYCTTHTMRHLSYNLPWMFLLWKWMAY